MATEYTGNNWKGIYGSNHIPKKSGFYKGLIYDSSSEKGKEFAASMEMVMTKAIADISKKARVWADTTCDMIKNQFTPVDTGNLRNSIEVSDHLDDKGYIVVGVNEKKLKGPKKLRSQKAFLKKTDTSGLSLLQQMRGEKGQKVGQMRYIPPYNYVPAAEKNTTDPALKFFVTVCWFRIAREQANLRFRG